MAAESIMPSEVRETVLAQHEELRSMLDELEAGAAALQRGEETQARVNEAATALQEILQMHMDYEEKFMVPEIHAADGFGPERVRHLLEEHKQQRQTLGQLIDAIRQSRNPRETARGVLALATAIRDDMVYEELHYVTKKLLKDDIMPTDTFGG